MCMCVRVLCKDMCVFEHVMHTTCCTHIILLYVWFATRKEMYVYVIYIVAESHEPTSCAFSACVECILRQNVFYPIGSLSQELMRDTKRAVRMCLGQGSYDKNPI